MAETSAIVQDMIRQALLEEPGVVKPETDKDPATFTIPDTFSFEQTKPEFKLKVFKKTLEEITRKLEDDPQDIPPPSLQAIKRGLIETRKGFYVMLETRIPQEIADKINEVLPTLKNALSFMLYATTLLYQEGEGRNNKYYDALSDCYDRMHQIKKLLKTW